MLRERRAAPSATATSPDDLGYRSIRRLQLDLGEVNVVVGPNGCGKTNLYRSLYLLAASAGGALARTLAEEGGIPSVIWAGPVLSDGEEAESSGG